MKKLQNMLIVAFAVASLYGFCHSAISACLTSPPYVFTYGQKPIPSGAVNADFAGAYTNFTDCTWPAARVTVADSGSYYATDTVESALSEIAIFTGYNYAATATTSALRYIGFATGTASITVAANLAPNGIIITLSSFITAGANSGLYCIYVVPVSVNGVDLATDGAATEYRFSTTAGISAATLSSVFSNTIVYTTADGWDSSISNTVNIGTAYAKAGSTCSAGSHSDDTFILQVIK